MLWSKFIGAQITTKRYEISNISIRPTGQKKSLSSCPLHALRLDRVPIRDSKAPKLRQSLSSSIWNKLWMVVERKQGWRRRGAFSVVSFMFRTQQCLCTVGGCIFKRRYLSLMLGQSCAPTFFRQGICIIPWKIVTVRILYFRMLRLHLNPRTRWQKNASFERVLGSLTVRTNVMVNAQ